MLAKAGKTLVHLEESYSVHCLYGKKKQNITGIGLKQETIWSQCRVLVSRDGRKGRMGESFSWRLVSLASHSCSEPLLPSAASLLHLDAL